MTIRNDSVKRISDSIINDVLIHFKHLREDYLKSKEFNALVNEKIAYIEKYEDLANKMGEGMDGTELKSATITLDEFAFVYNSKLDCFEYPGNLEEVAKSIVMNKLGLHSYPWTSTSKEKYLKERVLALVSTFDSNTSFEDTKKAVFNAINFEEILHNEDI